MLFTLIVLSESCKDNCDGNIEFDLPLQAYGIKDTLQIGDTIRIRLEIPESMPERYSKVYYDFIDYNFKLITYILRIDTLPVITASKNHFDWITTIGESHYNGDVFTVNPVYSEGGYYYEILMIARQKGLFEFGMNSVFSNRFPLKKLNGPCSENSVKIYVKLVNDNNNNYEFLQLSPEPVYQNLSRERFESYAGFCVFVR